MNDIPELEDVIIGKYRFAVKHGDDLSLALKNAVSDLLLKYARLRNEKAKRNSSKKYTNKGFRNQIFTVVKMWEHGGWMSRQEAIKEACSFVVLDAPNVNCEDLIQTVSLWYEKGRHKDERDLAPDLPDDWEEAMYEMVNRHADLIMAMTVDVELGTISTEELHSELDHQMELQQLADKRIEEAARKRKASHTPKSAS